MKIRLLTILVLFWMRNSAVSSHSSSQNHPQEQPAVVVELFTAEGCSDCPPADNLLSTITQRPDAAGLGKITVIPLEFHVNYWDEYGWHDRFDDVRYTERQRDYQAQFHIRSIYTPQSVIDGRYETVGNDPQKIVAAIRRAAEEEKPVSIAVVARGDSVEVAAHASNPKASGKVLLLITEDNLSTDVKAGENKSKTLHHDAVVRTLETVGKLKDGQFSKTVPLKLKDDWVLEKLHAVVLVQNNEEHVLGAAATMLSPASSAALSR